MQETEAWSLSQEDPLEEEMATHSSILAWKIPRTEELAGYSLWGRKESDTTERLSTHTHTHTHTHTQDARLMVGAHIMLVSFILSSDSM